MNVLRPMNFQKVFKCQVRRNQKVLNCQVQRKKNQNQMSHILHINHRYCKKISRKKKIFMLFCKSITKGQPMSCWLKYLSKSTSNNNWFFIMYFCFDHTSRRSTVHWLSFIRRQTISRPLVSRIHVFST